MQAKFINPSAIFNGLLCLAIILSKSIFFTKLAISLLLAKFACANLAAKFSAVNLLNS